jgi:AraC-like DNA-binding protein
MSAARKTSHVPGGELGEALASLREASGIDMQLVRPGARPEFCGHKSLSNPFCGFIHRTPEGRALCAQFDMKMAADLRKKSAPVFSRCIANMTVGAVLVSLRDGTTSELFCGRILSKRPARREFNHMVESFRKRGVKLDRNRAGELFFKAPVASRRKLQAAIRVAQALAKNINSSAAPAPIPARAGENRAVRAAKEFVRDHMTERITTRGIAERVGLSKQYFCRIFKRQTGCTFTDYVCRLRVARAKEMLADPAMRASEVAFAVGFQSIPYFNRVFRRHTGVNPTACRSPRQANSG